MKYLRLLIVVLGLTAMLSTHAADYSVKFNPAPGIQALIRTKGGEVVWSVNRNGIVREQNVSLDTEKAVHVEVGSYDFSGRLGFSVWHVDDGMGTYTIHRVFTFAPSTNRFVERLPRCGDEFINLKLDKNNRRLISTYFEENVPKSCTTRLTIMK